MTQLTTINILSLFETTKEQRKSFVDDLITKLDNGEVDPLKVHLQLKAMEEIVKICTADENYKATLISAASHHGKKFMMFNAEFMTKEVGVKYDYSRCGDDELTILLVQSDELNAKIKQRQDFLKTVPITGIDIRQGDELVTVYPPSKSSTTSVTVTLK
jgi:hypothetical protein